VCCSARYYTDSHRATKGYDWELTDDTKWLELAVIGIQRLGLVQYKRLEAQEEKALTAGLN
jgi:hypothetical protein